MFGCIPVDFIFVWPSFGKEMSANKKATALPSFPPQKRPSVELINKPNETSDLTMLDEIRNLRADLKGDNQRLKDELKDDNKKLRDDLKLEIRNEIHREMGEIKDSLEKINKDMEKIANKVEDLELNVKQMESNATQMEEKVKRMEEERKIDKQTIIRLETKVRQNCIKLRGVPEQEEENLHQFLIPLLADFVEEPAEQFPWEIDTMYRISSKAARLKKQPRDIVVYCVRKQTRDLIIQQSFKKELIIGGRLIQIFKDIPAVVLKSRRDYSFLSDQLKIYGVPFRWDEVEGLTLTWKQRRYKIDSMDKATDFWKRNRKEIEKARDQNHPEHGQGVRTRGMTARLLDLEQNKKEQVKTLGENNNPDKGRELDPDKMLG